jgi:hypothetical protein
MDRIKTHKIIAFVLLLILIFSAISVAEELEFDADNWRKGTLWEKK